MHSFVVSAGCLVQRGEWVLCVLYEDETIGFPKGHVEAGETLEQAAVRETYEETGSVVEVNESLGVIVRPDGRRVHLFRAHEVEFRPVLSNEGIAVWTKDVSLERWKYPVDAAKFFDAQ